MEPTVFVMTPATLRPDILDRTYSSFYKNMFEEFKRPLSLVINIDPIGDTGARVAMERVIRQYFVLQLRSQVCFNHPPQPSFPRAFLWLWNIVMRCTSDYAFYLEDDWELLQCVDLERMVTVMENNPSLATLRLPFTPIGLNEYKSWGHLFPWVGDYFKCPYESKRSIGWCGHPGLVNVAFMRDVMSLLRDDACPERQMKGNPDRDYEMFNLINKWDFGVYGFPGESEYVRDIGRQWRIDRNITKLYTTEWVENG